MTTLPLKTGIVSVADETCAILAFGGIMAGLYHAKTAELNLHESLERLRTESHFSRLVAA